MPGSANPSVMADFIRRLERATPQGNAKESAILAGTMISSLQNLKLYWITGTTKLTFSCYPGPAPRHILDFSNRYTGGE